MTEDRPAPRRRRQPAVVSSKKKRIESGFTSVRELLSYLLGAGVLLYGVVEASPDRQLVVVGAGLALLGAPIVGGIFEGKKGP